MKKLKLILIVSAAVTAVSSCATVPVSLTPSTTPIHDRVIEERLGSSTGESSAYSILGLWMIGRPDIGSAVERAVSAKEADALIEVSCYETRKWFILFSISTVTVEGEAVRFRQSGDRK